MSPSHPIFICILSYHVSILSCTRIWYPNQ